MFRCAAWRRVAVCLMRGMKDQREDFNRRKPEVCVCVLCEVHTLLLSIFGY